MKTFDEKVQEIDRAVTGAIFPVLERIGHEGTANNFRVIIAGALLWRAYAMIAGITNPAIRAETLALAHETIDGKHGEEFQRSVRGGAR